MITDLGILEPDPDTRELRLTHLHPGVEVDQVREATGWALAVSDHLGATEQPQKDELTALRSLASR